jgi:hypothetical protein
VPEQLRIPNVVVTGSRNFHAGWARMETIRAAKQVHEWKFTIPDDDGDTEITVTGFITENKTDPLEAEKITEFETMVTVSGATE